MLELSTCEPFAIGGRRICYEHPQDSSRCIKVIPADKRPALLRRSNAWWKRWHSTRYYDENFQDLQIYRYLFGRCGEAIHHHLPRVYGFVETDVGPGLDVELIRDADGRISLSGKEYTLNYGLDQASLEAVQDLENFLLKHRVLFRDPFPHNLAFRDDGHGALRLYIVDGLGRRPALPLAAQPSNAIETRIRKKVDRLRKGLSRTEQVRLEGRKPRPNGLLMHR